MAAGTAPPVAVVQVETTVATREQALALARALVTGRLAACAQVDAIESIYRWDGKVCTEAEWRVTLKTTRERGADLVAAIRARHAYALPQILLTPADATADYGRWVAASVAPAAAP